MAHTTTPNSVRSLLRQLSIPISHTGYRRLCIGIPEFTRNPEQSITKELYPYIAKASGCASSQDVESCIRRSILRGWEIGDRDVWQRYFPGAAKAPSNLVFIATLAEYLE